MFPVSRSRSVVALLAGVLLVGLLPATALAAAPDASPQSVSTSEDVALPIVLTGTDPDGDGLTFAIDTPPSNGALSGFSNLFCDGTPSSCTVDVTYTPDPNTNGVDSFIFTVGDGTDTDPATIDITVDPVNDAPAGANATVDTDEDASYVFTTSDFGFTDPNDSPANTLMAVKITTLPGAGALMNDSIAVVAGTDVSAADITANKLVFTPVANANGTPYTTFTFQVRDNGGTVNAGVDLDGSSNTITIDVTSVNDAPAGANATIDIVEDTPYAFVTTDFGLTDPGDSPADTLVAVKITTLPTAGSLTNNGIAVVAGADVSATDIAASKLVFTPGLGANGDGYATFTFQVRDNGGTLSGGVDLDGSPNTITIDVGGVNNAPSGADKTVTTPEDIPYTLVAADFGFTDPGDSPADSLLAVKITTLPGAGALTNDGSAVSAGAFVPIADITANKLVFTPAANASGAPYTTFTFQVRDNGGTVSGGVDLDPSSNTITIDVSPVNDFPVAVTDPLTVLEDAAATAVPVLANDTDTESDPLTITAKTDGAKGVVALTSATTLTYKPNLNATGSDSFSYTISDGLGGTAIGTVNVTITPANDVPNAVNDATLTVPESAGATSLAVMANDTDVDGDTLTITATSTAAHGTVAITGGGTGLTYDPVQLYYGTDVFTYTISDGNGGSDTATVLLTIVKDATKPTVIGPAEAFYGQTVGSTTVKARISWSGSDAGTGIAKYQLQVSVNGRAYATISLASATSTSINRTLTNERSYRYRVRATDRRGNVSAYAYGPTFKPGRYQNTSTSVKYSGSWTTVKASSALGGSHRSASSLSARASLTKTVRDFAWVATKTKASGSAQVWIDGVLAATVNLRSTSTKYRQLVFHRHFSTLGSHKIEIRPIGGGKIRLDAFLVTR